MNLKKSLPTCLAAAASAALLATACRPSPRLTRRHRAPRPAGLVVLNDGSSGSNWFSVTALRIESKNSTKSIFDLSDRGQQAFIEESATAGGKLPDKVRANLTPKGKPSGSVDLATTKARLVVALLKQPTGLLDYRKSKKKTVFQPADRVVWHETTLELAEPDRFEIVGYDKIDTGYEVVDLGKLTRSANYSLSAGGKVTVGSSDTDNSGPAIGDLASQTDVLSLGGELSGNAAFSETLGEEVQLRKRYVGVAAIVFDGGGSMSIVREGAVGIDLTGTSSIDVAIRAKQPHTHQVFEFKPKSSTPGQYTVSRKMMLLPGGATVRLCAKTKTITRHVRRGVRTVSEHDDRIQYVRKTAATARKVDLQAARRIGFEVELVATGEHIRFRKSGTFETATFSTEAEAASLVDWLSKNEPATFSTVSSGYSLANEADMPLPALASSPTPRYVVAEAEVQPTSSPPPPCTR